MNFKLRNMNSRRNFYHGSRKHTPGIPTWFITLPANCEICLLHCETIQLIFYYTLLKNIVHIVQCEGPLCNPCLLSPIYIYLQSRNINENVPSVGVDWLPEIQQRRAKVSSVATCQGQKWSFIGERFSQQLQRVITVGIIFLLRRARPSTLRKIKSSAEGSHAASAQHGGI